MNNSVYLYRVKETDKQLLFRMDSNIVRCYHSM